MWTTRKVFSVAWLWYNKSIWKYKWEVNFYNNASKGGKLSNFSNLSVRDQKTNQWSIIISHWCWSIRHFLRAPWKQLVSQKYRWLSNLLYHDRRVYESAKRLLSVELWIDLILGPYFGNCESVWANEWDHGPAQDYPSCEWFFPDQSIPGGYFKGDWEPDETVSHSAPVFGWRHHQSDKWVIVHFFEIKMEVN